MKSPVKLSIMDCFEAIDAEIAKVCPKTSNIVPNNTRIPMANILFFLRRIVRKANFIMISNILLLLIYNRTIPQAYYLTSMFYYMLVMG